MEELDLDIYDLPEETEPLELESRDSRPRAQVKKKEDLSNLTDEERFDRMYKMSLRLYEQMLEDPDIPIEKKDKAFTRILEVKGMLAKQKEEKITILTFGADYMEALNVAGEALSEALV